MFLYEYYVVLIRHFCRINILKIILPDSSDNYLVEIYIFFVENSVLLSTLVIQEDVIDKLLLFMSILMHSQITR